MASLLTRSGRSSRRSWCEGGRASIEVRGLDLVRPAQAGPLLLASAVEAALGPLDGVEEAIANPVIGRVAVRFDPDALDLGALLAVVEETEAAFGVSDRRFPLDRPEHPADLQPLVRAVAEAGADILGLGLAVVGRLLQSTPVPVELAGFVSYLEGDPRFRRLLETHLGTPVADLGMAAANALAQGLAQGPVGLLVDICYRGTLAAEAQSRRQTYRARHDQLTRPFATAFPGSDASVDRLLGPPPPRPGRAPKGPVERYSTRAGWASAAGAGTTLLATGDPRRAAATMLAGAPKAARLGREAFAAQLARTLAGRGIVVVDPRALRRLDDVDCLCLESSLLTTGRSELGRIRAVGVQDHHEIQRRFGTLFDPERPEALRRRGVWTVGPLEELSLETPLRPARLAALRDGARGPLVGLSRTGRLLAVAPVLPELEPLALPVLELARRHDLMVAVAGGDLHLADRLGADLLVDGGGDLVASVRMLQGDGCRVLLVAATNPGALSAADCALEVSDADGASGASMAGHLVAARGLRDAALLIDALRVARQASRQSVALALTGSGLASVLGFAGPARSAGGRALTTVNLAALLALANGTRAALGVGRDLRLPSGRPRPWHELPAPEVLGTLGSDSGGLSEAEVRRRRQEAAEPEDQPPMLWRSVLSELASPFTPVLAAGVAASGAMGGLGDAGLIGGVVGLNAALGGLQRYQAERAIRSLSRSSTHAVHVVRAGTRCSVGAGTVVPGDVLELEAGEVVPADCRILSSEQLEVDESSVTGESFPVAKSAEPSFAAVVAERSSMLYEGTSVAAGRARAVVVATGPETEAGRSQLLASEAPPRGVEHRLAQLSAFTVPAVVAAGGAVAASGLLRRQPLSRSVGSAVSLAVAAVPEGLPLLTTMAQLASAKRLAGRGALVRDPRAIEALGRVDVLCTDKTGTLTEGRIRLEQLSDGTEEATLGPSLAGPFRSLLAAALRATPEPAPGRALPHLTDRAVVEGAEVVGVTEQEGRPGWDRRWELPFEPSRSYHATAGESEDGASLSVKGAPETLLSLCGRWRPGAGERPLTAAVRRRLEARIERMARRGLRVLAVAERPLEPSDLRGPDEGLVGELVLLGFVLLADPVRPSATSAVERLQQAGVHVVMVTGDHPSTARGIAGELGILNGHRVITGSELGQLEDDQLDALLPDVSVFARVTPADKVRIVAAFQRIGRSVAMTGDGANDAPAIRMADVGMALGPRSTPAARGAADLVVTDERLETIVDALVEGRAMWGSVRDALALLLGGNLGEIGFVLGSTLLTGRSALSPRQLLLVNLLTDVAPALAIAVRPPGQKGPEELLAAGPDTSLGSALTRDIAVRAVATTAGASGAWLAARATGTRRRAATTALVALVGSQLGQTLTSGGRDPLVAAAGIGSAALMLGIVETPGVSQLFGCTPLGPLALTIAGASATGATALAVVGQWGLGRLSSEGPPALPHPTSQTHPATTEVPS